MTGNPTITPFASNQMINSIASKTPNSNNQTLLQAQFHISGNLADPEKVGDKVVLGGVDPNHLNLLSEDDDIWDDLIDSEELEGDGGAAQRSKSLVVTAVRNRI